MVVVVSSSVSTGTIFSVFKKTSPGEPTVNDILKPGTDMVAAGYCMYGSAIDVSVEENAKHMSHKLEIQK